MSTITCQYLQGISEGMRLAGKISFNEILNNFDIPEYGHDDFIFVAYNVQSTTSGPMTILAEMQFSK